MQVLKQKITEFFTVTLWGGEGYFMIALCSTPVVVLGESFTPDPAASLLLDDGTDIEQGTIAFMDASSWLESDEFLVLARQLEEDSQNGREGRFDAFVESYQDYSIGSSREAKALIERQQMSAMRDLPTYGMF